MACKFKPAYLLIAFQQQMAIITIHMHKNDGLEEKKKKNLYFHIREVLSHSQECGSWAAFPGGSRMIREGSHVWTRYCGDKINRYTGTWEYYSSAELGTPRWWVYGKASDKT